MKNTFYRTVMVVAILPIVVNGCAMQVTTKSEPATSVTSASSVATAASKPESTAPQPAKSKHLLPPPSELESRHGIQIAHIGLTAAGGLVDIRFKVLDATKVRQLLGDPANVPTLVIEGNPPLAAPHHALRGAKFSDGVVFYILYPNVRNAIKPGVEVSVAMGDVRLGPVTVQ